MYDLFINNYLADGKATPYGVYDIQQNNAWVNVGVSKDTASFAVSTLKNWWYQMGKQQYKKSLVSDKHF